MKEFFAARFTSERSSYESSRGMVRAVNFYESFCAGFF